MSKEHVLVILPHPDDESFGVAGLIALNRKKGIPVTYACATLGEMGRNMGDPLFANRETLSSIRKKELIQACQELDVELKMLGLRDKTLEFEDDEYMADIMESVINEVNPSLIVTFYPGYAVHPDHDACGEAVIRALYRRKKEDRPLTYCIAITNNREEAVGKPDVTFDIKEVADIKFRALKAHKSQTEYMLKEIGAELESLAFEQMPWFEQEVFWTYLWKD